MINIWAGFLSRGASFQRDGNYYKPGEIFRQPDLARTLERIAAKPDDFITEPWHRNWRPRCRKAEELITRTDDLAHYDVKEREPVRGMYRGYGNHQLAASVFRWNGFDPNR